MNAKPSLPVFLHAHKKFSTLHYFFNMLSVGLLLFLVTDCGYDASKQGQDTATYGTVKIACDESFQNLIEAQKMVFESHYTHAKIHVSYKPQDEAYLDFVRDSVRCLVTSQRISANDSLILLKSSIIPKTIQIASDGVALIVHPTNTDTLFTMKQLADIFSGVTTTWKSSTNSKKKQTLQIIFDNNNSSNLRYIKQKFDLTTFTSSVYVAGSNKAVVEYVASNPNALGVIGSNWISDFDDSTTRKFLKSVRILAIAQNENPQSTDDYYQPYQAYVATGDYPLSRKVYIINRETRTGLGTGFTAFCAGDIGQRIILKMGLVPAIAPVRIVKTKNKPISEM